MPRVQAVFSHLTFEVCPVYHWPAVMSQSKSGLPQALPPPSLHPPHTPSAACSSLQLSLEATPNGIRDIRDAQNKSSLKSRPTDQPGHFSRADSQPPRFSSSPQGPWGSLPPFRLWEHLGAGKTHGAASRCSTCPGPLPRVISSVVLSLCSCSRMKNGR